MRDLGNMGESKFALLCSSQGLTANKSQIDRYGWDYIVEFPSSKIDTDSLHQTAIECKIQVKATDKNDKKLAIKLSNLHRLATSLMPAFFIFLEFDNTSDVKHLYALHINEELISKILKRVHEHKQSKSKKDLNKCTMTLHYGEQERIDLKQNDFLATTFKNYIGCDYAKYVDKKRNHLRRAGFEDGAGQINFQLNSKIELEKLIDSSIGIPTKVNVSHILGFKKRFSINENNPFLECDFGTIEILPNNQEVPCKIEFKKDNFSSTIEFDAKLHLPIIWGELNDDLKRFRITSEFIDLTFKVGQKSVDFNLKFEEDLKLELHKLQKALELESLIFNKNKPFTITIYFDDKSLSFISNGSDGVRDSVELLSVIKTAKQLINYFDIKETPITSINEIRSQENYIDTLNNLIYKKDPVKFKLKNTEIDTEKYLEIGIILSHTSQIFNYILGGVFVFIADLPETSMMN